MNAPNVKTPGGNRASGKAAEAGNLEGNDTQHGASVAQRRADSIHKQALGQIGGRS